MRTLTSIRRPFGLYSPTLGALCTFQRRHSSLMPNHCQHARTFFRRPFGMCSPTAGLEHLSPAFGPLRTCKSGHSALLPTTVQHTCTILTSVLRAAIGIALGAFVTGGPANRSAPLLHNQAMLNWRATNNHMPCALSSRICSRHFYQTCLLFRLPCC